MTRLKIVFLISSPPTLATRILIPSPDDHSGEDSGLSDAHNSGDEANPIDDAHSGDEVDG
jgi:hypothetical protein